MIWKDLVKEHNLGAAIYKIEIKERIIPMNLIKLMMREQQHPTMKKQVNLQKIIDQQRREKAYYII